MSRLSTLRLLIPALLLTLLATRAQASPLGQYGNEWIQPGQPYYKIKVGQRGIHRLTNAWLTAAGVPVATVDPHRLQLWRRGQEQAIYVAGEADGRIDATDYVDFWGMPNDGLLEAEQYKDPTEQVSQIAPLYTDTAAYFLTIAPVGTTGRRMAELTSDPTGLTALNYHIAQLKQPVLGFYENGKIYDTQSDASLPWLDKSEGFVGKVFGYPGALTATLTLTMPSAPDTTHFTPYVDVMLASFAWAPAPYLISIVRIVGQNTTVLRTLPAYAPMAPYGHKILRVPLRYADFSATGVVSVRVGFVTAPTTFATMCALSYGKIEAAAPNTLGRQPRLCMTDSTLTGASQYLLFNTPPAAAMAYDVTNAAAPVRISGQTAGTQWGIVVPTPGPGARQVFVADDAAPRVPPAGRQVPMRILTPRPGAFLLVTSTRLLTDSTGIRPVRDYAVYRASAAGGGYDTVVMVMDQLIDVFHYGDTSPNAIRRFASFMNSGSAPAGFLFLLGRGFEPFPRQSGFGTVAQNRAIYAKNFVPTFNYPASDVMFTADFRNDSYVPRIPTGRIAAKTAADVAAYLEKIRAHEGAPPAAWRKEVLHLGGGKDVREQALFQGYLSDYARRVEDSLFFGGHVTSILRGNTGQTVSEINVSTQVNRGLTLITFFGHSSTTSSEIDVGLASDPLANYRNTGRYPMMLMNGCQAGNIFANDDVGRTFGEDWVMTPQRGAIAFMAHSEQGYPMLLNIYSSSFYHAVFNDSLTYGHTVGQQQQRAISLATPEALGYNENGIGHLTQIILQADPALKLYSPSKPDYVVADSTVSLQPLPGERLTARASGVQVLMRVRNYGKATRDSVRVQIRRTYPNNGLQTVTQTYAPILYGDSLVVTLPNPADAAAQGANQFDIFVDFPDSVAELSETNNRATIRYSFPSGSVFALFPQEFAIVPTSVPRLMGEYDQPLAQNRDYTFELDTDPLFNSPRRVQQLVNAGRYPAWQPTLPAISGQDSVVWYWRFRPQTIQPGEDSTWATSSFRHIAASPGGWSQSHYGQFARDKKFSITQAVPSGLWSYTPALLRLVLRTVSGDSVAYPYSVLSPGRTFAVPPNGITRNQSSGMRAIEHIYHSNIFMMVFDPHTLLPITVIDTIFETTNHRFRPIADLSSGYGQDDGSNNPRYPYNMFSAYGLTDTGVTPRKYGLKDRVQVNLSPAQYEFKLTGRVDSLAKMIERIPDGYIVALVTANRVPFDEMRAERPMLLEALRTLGSRLVDSLHSGDPFVLVGTKGGAPGTANEKTYNRNLPDRWGQTIILDTIRQTNEPRGHVTSTVIGPVLEWQDVIQTVKRETSTSKYALKVIPIDANGQDGAPVQVPIPASPTNSTSSFSLTNVINAAQYPKARLELSTADTVNRKAPQLEQWLVTYRGVPEGIIPTDRVPRWASDLTPQVDSTGTVRLVVPFQNISTVQFRDSVTAEFTLTLNNSIVGTPKRVKMAALKPDSIGWAKATFSSNGLAAGTYFLRVVMNPSQLQPEQYDFNNAFETSFRVVNPNLAPLVDVAFDGQHILYGDIVAPSPVITISVRDEDKNVAMDPQNVVLVLTRPGSTVGQHIPMTSSQVRVQAATATKPMLITYEPGRLDDGVYRLDVQATDPAGNLAGTEPHKSEFRVINETMISNFYPYPNPFSTSTRFLFTITGKVPQNLKIQIMTVTGRVVREITKEELGTDLRVGNNMSTATWNGTDEYGDPLANGVYLYRVVVQDDNESFKSFRTAGDSKAFHKTWGKLYILR